MFQRRVRLPLDRILDEVEGRTATKLKWSVPPVLPCCTTTTPNLQRGQNLLENRNCGAVAGSTRRAPSPVPLSTFT